MQGVSGAHWMYARMKELECQPNTLTYNILMRMFDESRSTNMRLEYKDAGPAQVVVVPSLVDRKDRNGAPDGKSFEAEDDDEIEDASINPTSLRSPPFSDPTPLATNPTPQPPPSDLLMSPPATTTTFDFWDNDQFEGVPFEHPALEPPSDPKSTKNATATQTPPIPNSPPKPLLHP
ncbi:hypothetical protein V8G54_027803 [Vigna mungo]|uniref:Uncharacterized protein n=1 Tax=Vigna mungo TaxID=3915 RepID=A0AAQ3RK06_VIGMU